MKTVPLFILFVSIYLACTPSQKLTPVEQSKILMDTFVQITIFDQNRQEEELEKIIESAFQRMKEIDRITNNYNDSSLISLVKFYRRLFFQLIKYQNYPMVRLILLLAVSNGCGILHWIIPGFQMQPKLKINLNM